MSSKFRGPRDRDKLGKDRRGQGVSSPAAKRAAWILKEETRKKIKNEVMPKRKERIKELDVKPGKTFGLYGKVVVIETIDDNSLIKIVGRKGRFLPQDLEPIKG